MSTALARGTYYIQCQSTSTVLTLTSGAAGTNLTAWDLYHGLEQQWNVTLVNAEYTFRNVLYGLYISFQDRSISPNPRTPLYGNTAPFLFEIEEYKGGFLIGTDSLAGNVLNLDENSFANNSLVIFWPLTIHTGVDNAVWYLNSTTGNSTTSSPSASSTSTTVAVSSSSNHSSTAVGAIAGSTVGGVVLLACLLVTAFLLGRRGRSDRGKSPDTPMMTNRAYHQTISPMSPGGSDPAAPANSVQQRPPHLNPVHKPPLNIPGSVTTTTTTSQENPVAASGSRGHKPTMMDLPTTGKAAGGDTAASPILPLSSSAGSSATDDLPPGYD